MARTPIRTTEVRPSAEAPKKKERLRKGAAMRSLLDIPKEMIDKLTADGIDLQWVTDSVLGKPDPQGRMAFEINCWEPVTGQMFNKLFDGMYAKVGYAGEITYDGLVLMWRPMELTEEARKEERAAQLGQLAAQANMIKGGQGINGLASGFEAGHPTALRGNVVERSIKPPMDIPRD